MAAVNGLTQRFHVSFTDTVLKTPGHVAARTPQLLKYQEVEAPRPPLPFGRTIAIEEAFGGFRLPLPPTAICR
jgi:hypothetical protein